MITTTIVVLLIEALQGLIAKLLFLIGKWLCWAVGFLTDIFEKVAGLDTVTYYAQDGSVENKLLIRVFFGNTNINTIYWGMALIGMVMCFAFTIVAVIKKSADSHDKMQQSMGDILTNCFKGITLILLMNFIVSATITLSATLMNRIDYLIVNAQNINLDYDITFDSEDYACMARSLNTIGNYSLNASYNSRYNLNSCYNDIREDLQTLAEKGKFDVTYMTTTYEDGERKTVNTWQSVLQSVYRSVDDISQAQPLDSYNTKLSSSLLEAMDIIKNDASLEALERFRVVQSNNSVGEMVSLDRMIMLLGSMSTTSRSASVETGMTDDLRGPYYYGLKDVFSYSECARDFDMSLGTWLYLTVIIVAFMFLKQMLAMVFNAAARIFNMLLLYISAPPFFAVTPLDNGGKLKQWTTAFIIQSLGLFGTIISLRLVMIFIPALFNGDIRFFGNPISDTFTRVIIMYASILTAAKASGMIVGILADNAGMQAIYAGDVGTEAKQGFEGALNIGKSLGGSLLSTEWAMISGAGGAALGAIGNAIYDKVTGGKGGGEGSKGGSKTNTSPTPTSKQGLGEQSKQTTTNNNQKNTPPDNKGNLGNNSKKPASNSVPASQQMIEMSEISSNSSSNSESNKSSQTSSNSNNLPASSQLGSNTSATGSTTGSVPAGSQTNASNTDSVPAGSQTNASNTDSVPASSQLGSKTNSNENASEKASSSQASKNKKVELDPLGGQPVQPYNKTTGTGSVPASSNTGSVPAGSNTGSVPAGQAPKNNKVELDPLGGQPVQRYNKKLPSSLGQKNGSGNQG